MKRKLFTSLCFSAPLVSGLVFGQDSDTLASPRNLAELKSAAEAMESAPPVSIQVNNLFANQWVHADKDGNLRGSVVAIVGQDTVSLPKSRVSLLRAGLVVASDSTDIGGEFLIEKVEPGIYTLVAEAGNDLCVFSVAVLDHVAGKHLPNEIQARVLPSTGGRTREIFRGQTLPEQVAYSIPAQDPLKATRTMASSHQVFVDSNGTLKGRLGKAMDNVDMSSTTVFILKEGVEMKRSKVASDGSFLIRGLVPGAYGLVAAGDQGIAAIAFCTMNKELALVNRNGERYVSQIGQIANELNLELGDSIGGEQDLPTKDATELTEIVDAQPMPMSPPGMGFGGGSMMGGGGGSIGASGGGGIGGLVGLAGIGGLIAVGIASADNNNDAPVASLIVPVTP